MINQDLFHRLCNFCNSKKIGNVHFLEVTERWMIAKILLHLGGFKELKKISFKSPKQIKDFCEKNQKKIRGGTIFFLCENKDDCLFIRVQINEKGGTSFKKHTLKFDVWGRIAIFVPQNKKRRK